MIHQPSSPDAELLRGVHVLQAFEAQAMEIQPPTPQDRDERPQETDDWTQALQSAVQALLFMLASVEQPGDAIQQLEAQLQASTQLRTGSMTRREELRRHLGITEADLEVLRAEVGFLEQALRLAALRAQLSDRGGERVQRMRANRRLAQHARHNAEELERIDGDMRRLEERREELLRDDIEQTEQFWSTATREVET